MSTLQRHGYPPTFLLSNIKTIVDNAMAWKLIYNQNNKTSITLIFSKGKSNVQQQKLDVQYVPNQLHDYVVLQIISLTIKTPIPLIDVAFFVADVFN